MAQEQAGRALRSAKWRCDLAGGVLAAWPADWARRTGGDWEAVRAAVPGGQHLPSSVLKGRTRQIATFVTKHGRLPVDVFELESAPRVAKMLLLSACDGQQATIERADDEPGRALLRLQLPTRPDPRSYQDWRWVACPIMLAPTIPAGAVLHPADPADDRHPGARRSRLRPRHCQERPHRAHPRARRGLGTGDWGPCCSWARCACTTTAASPHSAPVPSSALPVSWPSSTACADSVSACMPKSTGTSGSSTDAPLLTCPWKPGALSCETRSARCLSDARTSTTRLPGPLPAGPGYRRPGERHLCRRAPLLGGQGHGPHHQHAHVPTGTRTDRGLYATRGSRGGYRRGHRPGPRHLPALPPVPHPAAAPQSPRPAHHRGLEMGPAPIVRLAGRPRPRGLEAHRRTRPHPPEQSRYRPHQRGHGHSHGRGQTRNRRGHHTHAQDRVGPVQDQTHPAQAHPSDAQATPDTLPSTTQRWCRPASGGTRSHGPDPAAPRSRSVPGRDDDQHTHQPAQTARSSTGRRIPPARSRYRPTVGTHPQTRHH
ncbi:hypothetical protein ABH937_006876 [Kitasatospora sp. GAS1066B]